MRADHSREEKADARMDNVAQDKRVYGRRFAGRTRDACIDI